MQREGFSFGVVAIIVGGLAFVAVFTGFGGLAIALLAVAAGAAVAWKALDASRRRSAVRTDAGVRLLNTVWIPVRDELAEVVRGGGRVETSESVWTHAPSLSKQNSGGSFHREMERYINQRRKVASLAAGKLTTDEGIRQMESEQQTLLSISRELLPQARAIVEGMQGTAAVDTGAAAARPAMARPAGQAIHDAPAAPSEGAQHPQQSTVKLAQADAQPPQQSDVKPARADAQPTPQPERTSPVGERDAAPQPRMDEGDLDSMAVCAALFDSKLMSYETNRLFDERYKGETIRWHGTLRRASTYSYDFTFGEGGGTKAEFDLHEVHQGLGTRIVRAYVQLPLEDAARVSGRVGEMVTFEGRLLTCEGSSRRIYVGGGRVVD